MIPGWLRERHRLQGGPRSVARVVHRIAVSQELRAHRALGRERPVDGDLGARVTAVIKTFERPHVLARFVASIERLYPGLPIVVVDDSREPSALPSVTTVALPYDSGISAGRNEGVKRARTPYVLIADDDFVFFRGTRLPAALARMDRCQEIDIMGGQLIDLPLYRKLPPPRGQIFRTERTPRHPLGSRVCGLEVVDKVPNFFVARRERLELLPWNPRLRRVEHADFFTRALGVLTTVFNPELKAFHARTPFDAAYMAKRLDVEEPSRILAELYRA